MKLSPALVDVGTTADSSVETLSTATISVSSVKISKLAFSMCALAAIFYCFEYYLRVAPSVMSAELKTAFALSDAAFGNLAACYYYAYTPMQIPVGMMLDRFGARRILTFASLLCVIGTYLFAATYSIHVAQMGRFLVGFGSAFAYVGVLKITNSWLPKKYFALMVGIATTLGMVGAMSGELTMAYSVQRIGWQATLYIAAAFGVFLTLLIWIVLRDGRPEDSHSGEDHFNKLSSSEKSASARSISVIRGVLEIIKSWQMWLVGIIGCLIYLPVSVFAELWAVPFLETVGYTKEGAALGSSMIFFGFALGGPCWGILSDVIKSRRLPLMLGSLIATLFMFFIVLSPSQTGWWMYSALFLCSFAASAQVLIFAVANDINPSHVNATAVAFANMVVMLGGAVLPPLIGKFLDDSVFVVNGQSVYSVENYTLALMVLPISLLVSGILIFFLKESYVIDRK